MANLFLYYYEIKWLWDHKKRTLQKGHLFGILLCFKEDLCVIKDHLKCERNCKDIYPSQLELRKESIPKSEARLLDLLFLNDNNTLRTKQFDRRDTFQFSIVLMPHLGSNIPSNIYYSSMRSEILNFARLTSDRSTFVTLANQHWKTMQGSRAVGQ